MSAATAAGSGSVSSVAAAPSKRALAVVRPKMSGARSSGSSHSSRGPSASRRHSASAATPCRSTASHRTSASSTVSSALDDSGAPSPRLNRRGPLGNLWAYVRSLDRGGDMRPFLLLMCLYGVSMSLVEALPFLQMAREFESTKSLMGLATLVGTLKIGRAHV